MRKILYVIVISISVLILGACEVFGFQKATLIFENSNQFAEFFTDPSVSKIKVKVTSTSVGIENNKDNSFSFNLSEERSVSHTLEWWGFTDGEIKVKIYAQGELSLTIGTMRETVADGAAIASSKTITVRSGSVIVVNTQDFGI